MTQVAEAIQRLVDIPLEIGEYWREMTIQIVATLILILVVKFFFWEKITNFLEARQELMDKELTEATEMNEEARLLKQESEKAFEQVKQEAKQILEEAKTKGEDTKRELLAKAKDEAQNIKKSAQKDLVQEIEMARQDMRTEIISVASVLAEKVIAKEIDEKTYHRLLDEAIEEVRKQ